jgi:hypothetical protein
MELHVIIPGRAPELVVRVVDGRPVIVPPVTPLPAAYEALDKSEKSDSKI